MVANRAQGVGPAGFAGTWIRELVVDTRLVFTARGGGATAQLARHTLADFLRVTVVVQSAKSLTNIIITNFIHRACLVIKADILTELSITHLLVRAFSIAGTGHRLADTAHHGCRVGYEAGGTGTLGPMVDHLAVGLRAAGINGAWINTSVVHTRVRLGAVRISSATHDTHLVQTNMTKETIIVNLTRQHAKALQTSLIERTVFIRLTLWHTDALCTGH